MSLDMLGRSELKKDLCDMEGGDNGILYADSPGDKMAVENSRRERRRRKIIKELFETEKAYLNHLELIHKYFFFPLQFNCIVPESVHGQLFSNVEQIRDVNRTLLELMEQSSVGQAFRHLGPFLKLYSTYANNHQQALTALQEWMQKSGEFAEFIQTQEARPEVKGLKINALLITPVQRVPRYKMLLEDLLVHTPNDHHDYTQLQEATKQIGDIAVHINEHIRQHENFHKMLTIQKSFDSSAPKILQPGRLFLKEGPLKKVSRKGGKWHERMFFLFNDLLLYGKPRLVESGGRSYTCCCVLPIKHCKLERVFVTSVANGNSHVSKDADGNSGGVFKVTCKEESLVLLSEDTRVAADWSSAIERAIRKANDDCQTLRKPSSNKIPLRGRSLRKHRQQQKKSIIQGPQSRKKQARPKKPEPAESLNQGDCCSPQMRKMKVEPLRERVLSVYDNLPAACASSPKHGLPPAENCLDEASPPKQGAPNNCGMAGDNMSAGFYTAIAGSGVCGDFEGGAGNRVSVISEGGESLWLNDSSSVAGTSYYCSNSTVVAAGGDEEDGEEEEEYRGSCGAVVPGSRNVPACEGRGRLGEVKGSTVRGQGSVVSTASGTEIYYPSGSAARLTSKPRASVKSKIKQYLRRPFTRLQRTRNAVTGSCSPFSQRCSTQQCRK